jgi:hypothetical protein
VDVNEDRRTNHHETQELDSAKHVKQVQPKTSVLGVQPSINDRGKNARQGPNEHHVKQMKECHSQKQNERKPDRTIG